MSPELESNAESAPSHPHGLNRAGRQQIANFQRLIDTTPKFTRWLLNMLSARRYLIGAGMIVAVIGVVFASVLWVAIGLIAAFSMPLRELWQYRGASRYEKLLRAYARGDAKTVIKAADWLTRNVRDEKVVLDAAMRKACVLAKQNSMHEALDSVENWSVLPKRERPENFDSRLAVVYYFGGNLAQYLELTRDAHFQDPENPVKMLDLAIAEARQGDLEKAELLIKGLSVKKLPPYGLPFIDWAKGLVKQRQNDPSALDDFAKAVTGLFNYDDQPIVWTAIAMCVGDYAMTAHDSVASQSAEQLLQPVWPMLQFHGSQEVVNTLVERYPSLSLN